MCGIHLQEAEVSRLKNLQSTNNIALPCSLAWFSLWILSLFLYGIYRVVLWARREYIIAAHTSSEFAKIFRSFTATCLLNPHFPFAFSFLDWTSITEQRESANTTENTMGSTHTRLDLYEALHFRFHGLRSHIVHISLVSAV